MKTERRLQLSVYLENRVGALSDICKLISDRKINLLGICAIDTVEEAVLRIVDDNEGNSLQMLEKAGFQVVKTEVLLIELENEPGATGRMATLLSQGNINIDYIYATAHSEMQKAYLVLRTHQIDETEKLLQREV